LVQQYERRGMQAASILLAKQYASGSECDLRKLDTPEVTLATARVLLSQQVYAELN
jgi:hypothetical protein